MANQTSTKDIAEQAFKRISSKKKNEPKDEHKMNMPKNACSSLSENNTSGMIIDVQPKMNISEELERGVQSDLNDINEKTWTPEESELIEWFLSATNLPLKPYMLSLSVRVADPDKFYASLREGIEVGPRGPRCFFGSLIGNLKSLNEIIIMKIRELND